jgi:hypothetical protein
MGEVFPQSREALDHPGIDPHLDISWTWSGIYGFSMCLSAEVCRWLFNGGD